MTDKKGTLLHVLKKKPVWWTEKTKQFSKRLPGIAHLFFSDTKLFNQERCQFSNIPFFRERCFFFDLSRASNKEKILNGLHKRPANTTSNCFPKPVLFVKSCAARWGQMTHQNLPNIIPFEWLRKQIKIFPLKEGEK